MLDLIGLPKVNLHCHLAGSLRPQTFLLLAREQGKDVPRDLTEAIDLACVNSKNPGTLRSVLDAIASTYPVLQTHLALERAAYEVAFQNASLGVDYLEIRCAPSLHTKNGLRYEDVISAILEGLKRAEHETSIYTGLIICIVRGSDLSEASQVLKSAERFIGSGFVGLDLAGDEMACQAKYYYPVFEEAQQAGLGITVHAGEIGGPENILEAIETLGANRIGHGIAAISDKNCIELLREKKVALEICPTSNLCTGVVTNYRVHPALELIRAGVKVTISDDDPGTFSTNIWNEIQNLLISGMTMKELYEVQRNGFETAFCPPEYKERFKFSLAEFERESK